MVPEPAGSSPYPQESTTGPYPEPLDPLYTPPAIVSKIHSDSILLSVPWSSKWSLSFWLSHRNEGNLTLM
jgi:hypothetical protein